MDWNKIQVKRIISAWKRFLEPKKQARKVISHYSLSLSKVCQINCNTVVSQKNHSAIQTRNWLS